MSDGPTARKGVVEVKDSHGWRVPILVVAAAVAGAALFGETAAMAAPVWPSISTVASYGNLNHVTNIVAPQDGTGRLFVTEKTGLMKVISTGAVLPTPALDIRSLVSTNSERGLLGLAFPPGFAAKQYAYIYYTDKSGTSRFYRIHISASDPNVFDRSTMQLILKVAQPYANHNGGQLAFGPDGYLYIGLGDGGSHGDPGNRGQNRNTLLGKILRIDVESTPNSTGYRIPTTNPFRNQKGRRGEIFAYGLRNPWRFSFDPLTGALWIGDVGQDKVEEIDRMPAGVTGWNFGWSRYEGTHLFKARSKVAGFHWPVWQYLHPVGDSVTGGYVYRGAAYPSMQGIYFLGDFGVGKIWGIQRSGGAWVTRLLLDTRYQISTFGVDENGDLWLADYAGGRIYKVGTP
jgi:glucose/arabinose dehydrogenase